MAAVAELANPLPAPRSPSGRFELKHLVNGRKGIGAPRLAITAYATHGADRIVAEVNDGGDMVGATLRMIDPNVAFTAVRAARWRGPNRWRRSTSTAASITSAPSGNSKTS